MPNTSKPGDLYRAAAILRPEKAKAAQDVAKRLDEAKASREKNSPTKAKVKALRGY